MTMQKPVQERYEDTMKRIARRQRKVHKRDKRRRKGELLCGDDIGDYPAYGYFANAWG